MPVLLADGGASLFVLTLFNALTEGSTYALIAVGYTMVYGIVRLINFAHGEVYMIGAVTAWWLFVTPQVPLWLALPLAMGLCAGLGWLLDRLAYRPLRKSTRLAALITAIGMSLILQTVVQLGLDPNFHSFPEVSRARAKVDGTIARAAPSHDAAQVAVLNAGVEPPVWTEAPPQEGWVPVAWTRAGAKEPAVAWITEENVEVKQGLPPVLNRNVLPEDEDLDGTWVGPLLPDDPGALTLAVRGTDVEGSYAPDRDAPAIPVTATVRADGVLEGELTPSGAARVTFEARLADPATLAVTRAAGEVTLRRAIIKLPLKDVLIWVAAAAMMTGLHLLVQRTRLGKAMRACALDQTTAALMGIDVNRVIAATFMIGSAMAAVAGVLYSVRVGGNISFRMGYYPGVIAFAAAVLGGIGNLKGALLGGLLLGFAKSFFATYAWSEYDFAFCFSVMILVIIFRPYGLLGRPSSVRA